MHTQNADEIRGFVLDTFLLGRADQLSDDASFIAEGFVDSTGILELVLFVEERYGIQVADGELTPDNFDSVSRIAAFVSRKLSVDSLESAFQTPE